MIKTINELGTTITKIRTTINEGIQSKIEEDGSDLTNDDLLGEGSPLSDYVDAINKLKSSITSTDQQIIILYTYAKDLAEADSKKKPTISWVKNDQEEYEIKYEEFDPYEWVPSDPIQQDKNIEKLWIRFASILKGQTTAEFGIPIQMTGDRGAQGEQGIPGTDAVILTAVHRLVKLYHQHNDLPEVPTFYKSVEQTSNFANDLDSTRIYYVDKEGNNVFVDSSNSIWKLTTEGMLVADNINKPIWEIDVDINSKTSAIQVLSSPIRKNIVIDSITIEYAANNSGTDSPEEGWDEERPSMDGKQYMWSRTTIKYSNGHETTSTCVIQEWPTVIESIDTTYCVTMNMAKPESVATWSYDVPTVGPVIWKKETITYTSGVGKDNERVHTNITPIAIQGESGIKFIGTVISENDLPTESLVWDDEYIGRMGMLVGTDTYIWYGTSEPTPPITGIKKIGENYWLDMGPIHVCNWDASEGELGYVRNRTHYKTNNDIDEVQIWRSNITSKGTSSTYFVFWWDCDVKLEYIPVVLRQSSTEETVTVNCYSGQTWIDPSDRSKGYITGDFSKGYGEVCLDPIGWSFVDIAQQSEIGYGYTETVTRIPEEYVSTNHDVLLSELFVLIINKKLIPGHTYTFDYDNKYAKYKLHATAITSDKLSPELQCSSDRVSSIVVSWPGSGFGGLRNLSSVAPEDKFVNLHNGIVLVDSSGLIYDYNDAYMQWTTSNDTTLDYGAPYLNIIKYKDYNCNEWVNPNCTFDQYSKYNTIKGNVKVTCINSSNNIVQGNTGVVNISLSNNNTITMHLSGTLNVSKSDSNIIFGQVTGGKSKKVSEEVNCIIYADDKLSHSDESNEIVGFNVVANTIDVSGKIYAKEGFFKQ